MTNPIVLAWLLSVVLSVVNLPSGNTGEADEARTGNVRWKHLSSKDGTLPRPGESTQQTGALVADLDRDGVNDFVLSFRQKGPALVWYHREKNGWSRRVIEPAYLTIEAGGAAHDIDGDGDLDLVFGEDYQGRHVYWWENPSPRFDAGVAWTRHVIKDSGATQHHDQVFADVLGKGKPQLIFWNQSISQLFLAEIPENPRSSGPWPIRSILTAKPSANGPPYTEGLAVDDIDGDGKLDLLAGNGWLKHRSGDEFTFIPIGEHGGRIASGRFQAGKAPQVVIAPGDGVGPLMVYESNGDPTDPKAWKGRSLLNRPMVHGHSLQITDIDRDGHLDVFAAEMAKWREDNPKPDHPEATAWILFGDGNGGFRTTTLATSIDFHEARVADLDGDGDLDILDKPYTWEAPRVDLWINESH